MKDSTDVRLTNTLINGDEVEITADGYSVTTTATAGTGNVTWVPTTGTTTIGGGLIVTPTVYPTIAPTTLPLYPTPTIFPHSPVAPLTFERSEEYFQPPRCAQCRTDVSLIESFVEKDVLTMVFVCHGEKRRVDISLKKFKGNEQDAKEYLLEQIDELFSEEADWQKLSPKTVRTENADRNAIERWLAA